MSASLRAEWTKLRTVPSTVWTVLALVVCTVGVGALATGGLSPSGCAGADNGCAFDTPRVTLAGVYLGQVAVVVLAVLVVTVEYDTAMIRTTLAANPRRTAVLTAKAAVVTAVVLGTAAVTVLCSLIAGRMILPGQGFTAANGYPTLSLADASTLRAFAGTVVYLGLVALLGIGVGMIIRHTGGAIMAVLSLLYTFPIVATLVTDEQWRRWINKLAPMTAGLAIQATRRLETLPIAPWPGLGVLAAYAGAAMIAGAVLFIRRDA